MLFFMKKTLLLMVAGMMVLCLAACDKSDNNSDEINEPDVVIDENEVDEPEIEGNEGFVYGAEGE
jgi:hypothetical protein